MDPTLGRWMDAVRVAVPAGVVALALAVVGDSSSAWALVVGGLVGAWFVSPWSLAGPHTSHAAALDGATEDDVVVYWRPGCTVCLVLRARLSRRQRRAATWVNVVRDHEAALFVRSKRSGSMVTPTVVTGAGDLLPTDPDVLAGLLDAR